MKVSQEKGSLVEQMTHSRNRIFLYLFIGIIVVLLGTYYLARYTGNELLAIPIVILFFNPLISFVFIVLLVLVGFFLRRRFFH